MSNTPRKIRLSDYRPPAFLIAELKLDVNIADPIATVTAILSVGRNPASEESAVPLVLLGESIELVSVAINDVPLRSDDFILGDTSLTICDVPDEPFSLTIVNVTHPDDNTALEGLYRSGSNLCTQNEPEGFRRFTYFPDRPDVMSVYTTRIEADKAQYPVLLANGNRIDGGDLDGGRHFAVWHDPHAKPSYLFALVAGELGMVEDSFTTCSGRDVVIQIFVDPGNEDRCQHAIDSLKKSMKWDEDVYGLEYDLDIFMIVAVDAFNFGAMENKGLNIFNSQCALADPKTATDDNYQRIESIIAHEYFHNWTGNRVTCRDWFQLTLKEGLTVFRDQEFSADVTSRPVKRIADAASLRDYQFVEDSSPTAHPIKPSEYIEINNFYTSTVYKKGAEVIRMIHTFIGAEAFRRGTDLYFERHDGQAVTTEDFIDAMQTASGFDLTQFQRWYHQAGTPTLTISGEYDADTAAYRLTVGQRFADTARFGDNKPCHLPLAVGLLDSAGADMPLCLKGSSEAPSTTCILSLTEAEQVFEFTGVSEPPTPSLLRSFSAPVNIEYPYTTEALCFLLANDSDAFNRYQAGQNLAVRELGRFMAAPPDDGENFTFDEAVMNAFGRVLTDGDLDCAFKSHALRPPTVTTLVEPMPICDFDAAFNARQAFRRAFAARYADELVGVYEELADDGIFSVDTDSMHRRMLRNTALGFLTALEEPDYLNLALRQFESASNMTNEFAALACLCQAHSPQHDLAVAAFYKRWKHESLVMNKWLAVQAGSPLPNVIERVRKLERTDVFERQNPNKIRALYGAFSYNFTQFHHIDASGYTFIADKVLDVSRFNPNAAATLALAFKKYPKLDQGRKAAALAQLERILAKPELSKDVYEIVSTIVASG
jgi:aminopeptidase N